MPGGDRTGPRGMGPMTGRGAGYCAGSGAPGYMNPGPGRGFGRGGFGRGGGWGRGWRHMYHATGLPGWAGAGWGYGFPTYGAYPQAPVSAEQEMEALRAQAEMLEGELSGLRKRMEELEAARGAGSGGSEG